MKNGNTPLLTPEGKLKLEAELKALREERPHALDDLQRARAQGDLKENSAYQAARERLTNLDRRIIRAELTLRNGKVITKNASGLIQLGSSVTLSLKGKELNYHIVGETEIDIKQGKISSLSPLGKVLLGKKKGEEATLTTPGGTFLYTIKEVK